MKLNLNIESFVSKYISKLIFQSYVSKNLDFYILAGYTGFVPKARGLLGLGYPVLTNIALKEFQDEMDSHRTNGSKPVVVQREDMTLTDTKPIYPAESGLVPHYTGHIPGIRVIFLTTKGDRKKAQKTV